MPSWQRFLLAERSAPVRYGTAVLLACFSLLLLYLLGPVAPGAELQPLATVVLQNGPFGVVSVPSAVMIVWAALFCLAVLWFAVWQFRRRPL